MAMSSNLPLQTGWARPHDGGEVRLCRTPAMDPRERPSCVPGRVPGRRVYYEPGQVRDKSRTSQHVTIHLIETVA